jgi:murein DD-endopeptidase MepM/ murein hydrolase activator NlpD
MKRRSYVLVTGALWLLLAPACHRETSPGQYPPCTGYPAQEESEYVLPWPVGLEFQIYTGNCRDDISTHRGDRRYAYDIRMPFGSTITAARAGTVVTVVESHSDSDHAFGHENFVTLSHGDGTLAFYFHMAQYGVVVGVGDTVQQGETIGTLGSSGSIGRDLVIHLHFEAASSIGSSGPISIPSTFRNTRPHPTGLVEGESYRAEEY